MSSAARVGTSQAIVASDGRRYAFADHNCFACGGQNPIGMHLDIVLGDGHREHRTGCPTADFVGWEEKVHGGILATLLDEVMALGARQLRLVGGDRRDDRSASASPASPGERLVATGRVDRAADAGSTTSAARSAVRRPAHRARPRAGSSAHRRPRSAI